MTDAITVFTARRIHTMEPALAEATAIAVRQGRIVEVGSVESLRPWLRHHDHVIDDRFADAVLLPGLIDPHLHPSLMALLLATEWVTPESWDLADRRIEASESKEEFLNRLRQFDADMTEEDGTRPLVVFGFHSQYHGDVVRADLDDISTRRPIVAWQRSFHEVRCNTPALAWVDAAEGAAWDPHIELETGRMYESGMIWALRTLQPFLMTEGRFEAGLRHTRELVHQGGVTAIADAGFGFQGWEGRYQQYVDTLGAADTPFRTYLMPGMVQAAEKWPQDTFANLEAFTSRSTERLSFIRAGKFLADGAFIAQLMVLGPPGYIDGHEGAWLNEPERLVQQIRPSWQAGYDIHIHTNGDVGVTACLDAIEALLHEQPRFDHRTTLHHFGISTQAQIRRMAGLGVHVSANGYYLYLFGDRFGNEWLGHERASQMTRLGSAVDHGLSVSLHSDLPMGPVRPLLAAQAVATRRTRNGAVMGEPEGLSLHDALKAVTIDAAFQLRLDHEIGSLAAGKLADITVLESDPYEVGAHGLSDIDIRATIVGGSVFPLA